MEEYVSHDIFAEKVDNVEKEPKQTSRRAKQNSETYNLIIKKVQREPEAINKIVFKELYKFYVCQNSKDIIFP